tara:strand:+ start:924 stop:1325 length:402 start_codon:yes stop_codon:yes gene_type:complete
MTNNVNGESKADLIRAYMDANPDVTVAEAAKALKVTRNYIYVIKRQHNGHKKHSRRKTSTKKTADSYQVDGDHYTALAVRPWDAMQSWMTDDQFVGYLKGNAIKYIARMGKKNSSDLQKAQHYMQKLAEVLAK